MTNYGPSKFETGSLRDLLKEGTRDAHGEADRLVTEAILGNKEHPPINRETYRIFLNQLYFVYQALEEGLHANQHLVSVGSTHFPDRMNRLPAIAEDLNFYYGSEVWMDSDNMMLDSTRDYVTHLKRISADNGDLLISHAYVRYQGDLSGGKQIRSMLKRLFKLSSEPEEGQISDVGGASIPGVKFYEFPDIQDRVGFKAMYSARVNELEITDEQTWEIVKEAEDAFRRTVEVFKSSLDYAVQLGVRDTPVDKTDQIAVAKMYGKGCPLMKNTCSTGNKGKDDNCQSADPATCNRTLGACSNNAGCPFTSFMKYAIVPILLGVAIVTIPPLLGAKRFF